MAMTIESKNEKFLRLSSARLEKAVKAILLLENLSGANYEFTEEQVQHVVTGLQQAVQTVSEAYGITTEIELTAPSVVEQPTMPHANDAVEVIEVTPTYTKWNDWETVDKALHCLIHGDNDKAREYLKLALAS